MRKNLGTTNLITAALAAFALTLTACGGLQKTAGPAETGETSKESAAPENASSEEGAAEEKAETERSAKETEKSAQTEKILIAAAASLKYSYDDQLIPMFEQQNPGIRVEATYDSSGKLQTQIEEGMEADVFMSAAMKQMNALKDENLVDQDSIVELLENKLVLIVPADGERIITSFEDLNKADSIAVGDPASVPVGQYSEEVLTSLGIWEEVKSKASLGTSVTEVLNWVAEGSADAGIVYATDAATTDRVKVIAEAPEGSLAKPVVYPVGVVSQSGHKEAAASFIEFLQSDEAAKVFEKYGFSRKE